MCCDLCQVDPGFKVDLYATQVPMPRALRTAPNGDVFVAASNRGEVHVLRGLDAGGKAELAEVFARGLRQPFGLAFYPPGPSPQWLYIGSHDSIDRLPYQNGDLQARGKPEHIADLPGGGHSTRDLVSRLSRD